MELHPVFAWSIAAFVFMGAISMIVQAVASYKMFQAVREIRDHVAPLAPRALAALDTARETLLDARSQVREVSAGTLELIASTKTQLGRVEEVVVDAAGRARNQLARTELVVEDTVNRVQETVAAVQGTILKPIREVNGIAAGVKAGLGALLKTNKRDVERVAQDEEMFI
jgi:hypothetical protein